MTTFITINEYNTKNNTFSQKTLPYKDIDLTVNTYHKYICVYFNKFCVLRIENYIDITIEMDSIMHIAIDTNTAITKTEIKDN